MTLPGAVSYGTIHGTIVQAILDSSDVDTHPDSAPVAGTVVFRPTVPRVSVGGTVVLLDNIAVDLDGTGSFSVDLVATDDIDTQPNGWGYTIQFFLNGVNSPTSTTVSVPAGTDQNISDVLLAPPFDPSLSITFHNDVHIEDTETGQYSFASMADDSDSDVFAIDGVSGEIVSPDVVPPEALTFSESIDPSEGWYVQWTDDARSAWFGIDVAGRWHVWSNEPLMMTGDSMVGISALKDYDHILASLIGRPVINQGTSGDLQQWIDARVNARPAGVTVLDNRDSLGTSGTIPATGSCNLVLDTELAAIAAHRFPCIIAGISGVFQATELPGSPDPLAANDPGSIAYNYNTGVFTRNADGIATLVPDGTPLQPTVEGDTGIEFRRCWQLIQPSRHNFTRRYQRLTVTGTGGSFKLGIGTISTAAIAWVPAPASLGSVTFTASTDRVTFGSAHGLSAGAQISFAGVASGAPLVSGKVYTVQSAPTSTTITLVGSGVSGALDITSDGTATGATITAETALAMAVASALATALGTGWTGTVSPYTGLPGITAAGQIEVDWGVADSPIDFVLAANNLTGSGTVTFDTGRTGINDGLSGVAAQISRLTSDARMHLIVTDIGPFPGEEIGTTKRALFDAYNDALREAFGPSFFPLWALMRNINLITALGYTPMSNGSPTTTNDDVYAISQRMTPPTFLDQGGGTFSGGHPGPAGAIARGRLISDLFAAQNAYWKERG